MKSYRKQKSEAKRLEKLLLKQQKLENKVPKVRGPRKMMRTFVITGAFYYQRHVVHMVMTALGFKLDTEVRKLTQYLFRATPHDPAHDIATYQNYQPLTERTKVVTTMEGFKNVVQSVLGVDHDPEDAIKAIIGKVEFYHFYFQPGFPPEALAYAPRADQGFEIVVISKVLYHRFTSKSKWDELQGKFI